MEGTEDLPNKRIVSSLHPTARRREGAAGRPRIQSEPACSFDELHVKLLTSSTPHAAWIPTESDFSPISSLASSHRRLISAEDYEEASLFSVRP